MHESELCAFAPLREALFQSRQRMNEQLTSRKGVEAQRTCTKQNSAPLREVYCSFILCLDWKRVSRKGAKAQSSFSCMSFAPLRLCVRFIVHSFSVVTGKGSHAKARRRRVLIRSLPLRPSRFRRVAGGVYLASLIDVAGGFV